MYKFNLTAAETDILISAVSDYAATLRREFPADNKSAKVVCEVLDDLREQFKAKLYGEKSND